MYYTSEKLISGFSTCFRQHKAESHCSKLHGYALEFKIIFGCKDLDERNWCVDFGGLRDLKAVMAQLFDHTTVIAKDDPHREAFKNLAAERIINLVFLKNVGCEAFAEEVFDLASQMFNGKRTKVISVTCIENKTNSATYQTAPDFPEFRKATLILGPDASWRTEEAKQLSKRRNTVWANSMNDWKASVQDDTEVLIFDGICDNVKEMKHLASLTEFNIRRPYSEFSSLCRMPQVIFTSSWVKEEDVLDSRHFTIINLNQSI